MPELLFSYGTLQLEKVRLETFGRILKGSPDVLKKSQCKFRFRQECLDLYQGQLV